MRKRLIWKSQGRLVVLTKLWAIPGAQLESVNREPGSCHLLGKAEKAAGH